VSARRPRPWRVLRWLIAARRLGERRHEVARDLEELFQSRLSARGAASAQLRYLLDVLSLWTQPLQKIDPVIGGTRAPWSSGLGRDVVYATRVFLARPGLAIVTVLGLALAIGVGTSVFAVLNAVALRPLGVPNPSAVKHVMQTSEGSVSTAWPYREAVALRERSIHVPLEISINLDIDFATRAGAERPDHVASRFVGGSYFDVLRGRAALGRLLTADDDRASAPAIVVISHHFWVRALGSDPTIVGKPVWLNGTPFTVIGVTERSFSDEVDRPPAAWAPLSAYAALTRGMERFDRGSDRLVTVVARVPDAMGDAQATTAVSAVAAEVAREHHGTKAPAGASARLDRLDSRFTGPQASTAFTAIAVVLTVIGLILLLACANVTNLLLASGAARHREIGMRLALGATRGRLVRQLLTESTLLGITGGFLGLIIAMWGLPILKAMVGVPTDLDTSFDLRVYLFLTLVSVAAGIGAGLVPARHGSRGDLLSALKGDAGSAASSVPSTRWRSRLVGVQAAASVVLLALALLLTRATSNAGNVDVGFDAEKLATITAEFHGYDDARMADFWNTALERVRAVPGIESAAIVTFPPFGEGSMISRMRRGSRWYTASHNQVSPDYFTTVGLDVLGGRVFTAEEARTRARVVVVSQSVAREFWPGQDPIGLPFDRISDETPAPRIIGIVADAVTMRLSDRDKAAVYTPILTDRRARLIVRSASAPGAVIQPVHAVLRNIDPDLRPSASLMSDNIERQLNQPRAMALLAATIGGVALALALVGVYGVAAFLVAQRTVEIGVRMAIGATLQNVVAMLLRDTLRPVVMGLGIGVLVAILAGHGLSGVLFGVSPYDPVALLAAAALLIVTATMAVIIPARRAARVDPVSVLRS
jgi:predicted permease